MSPIICRCCGQHIEPAPVQPRTNPNICAACEASKGFETQIFERQMNANARAIAAPLPGPKREDARRQSP